MSFSSLEAAGLAPSGAGTKRFLSLTGANCAFRREALTAIGGFDEAYTYFLEETDVCLRLVEAGWTLTVVPHAEVHHAFAENHLRFADRTPRSLLPSVRSTAYFAMRHAAPEHGLASVARHLSAYAGGLQTSVQRRGETGLIGVDHQQTLGREIREGLTAGVRQAFADPPWDSTSRLRCRKGGGAAGGFLRHRPRREPDGRLRLCLMSQDYTPGPTGGIAVWTRALARGLVHAGHEVSVLTRSHDAETSVQYEDGVWVHRLASEGRQASAETAQSLAHPAWADRLPSTLIEHSAMLLQEARRIMPRRGFDLAMAPIWDLEPAALLAEARLPTVVSLHTTYALAAPFKPDWDKADFRARHVDRVIAAELQMLARAPHLLANSDALVEDLARVYRLPDLARRVHVVPHGLPDHAGGRERDARSDDDGVEVLFVGRLEPRKGGDVLLEAAARVLRIEPRVRFVIVGDDRIDVGGETLRLAFQRQFARAGVLDRITFTGAIDQEALLDRFAACDLFVAPSRYESFGLVFVEAMMFAKPCIGCDVGGIGEVVADGETGLLVQPGDVVGLSAAILALVHDPVRRRAMGLAGRRRYETRFTDRAMVHAMERFFEVVKRNHEDHPGADASAMGLSSGLQPPS